MNDADGGKYLDAVVEIGDIIGEGEKGAEVRKDMKEGVQLGERISYLLVI